MRITIGRRLAVLGVTGACLLATASGVTGVSADANLAGPTVKVTAAGPVRTVTPTLLGLNGVNTTGPLWDSASFDSVLRKFSPGVIRYPGGTVANYWSWPDGWFQPGEWPGEPAKAVNDTLPVFGDRPGRSGGRAAVRPEHRDLDGAVGSAADNTAQLDQQLQALRSAAGDGLPVTMVELGNELYQSGYISTGPDGQDYTERFPTAADYATQMNAWISALHSAFPGVKVAAVATDANDVIGVAPRRSSWNATVLPLLKGEDAVTIHDNLRVSDASSAPATVLAYPYLHFQKLKAHELALFHSDQLPVWVTEFNLADVTPGHVFQGTWLHGLFVAAQALLFTGDPDITYAGLDATIGTALAPIFSSTRGFGSSGPGYHTARAHCGGDHAVDDPVRAPSRFRGADAVVLTQPGPGNDRGTCAARPDAHHSRRAGGAAGELVRAASHAGRVGHPSGRADRNPGHRAIDRDEGHRARIDRDQHVRRIGPGPDRAVRPGRHIRLK